MNKESWQPWESQWDSKANSGGVKAYVWYVEGEEGWTHNFGVTEI